ncbi:hypothetical protein SAMN02745115_01619 [[Eubacterium] yurii]|nr:hypothetical protein SAMN02745115_01619 [[Eubacterium] yurii]
MKRFLIIIIGGIAYGMALLFCGNIFELSDSQMKLLYICSAIAIFIITLTINLVYNFIYARKINKLIPLLEEEKYDDYLDKMTAIRNKVKSKYIRDTAQLNLSPALLGKKEYTTAVKILEELESDVRKVPLSDMVRRLNLCFCHFYLKNYDKAEALYINSKELFDRYKNIEIYHKNFVLLDLFMDICCRGKKDGLAERIKESRTKFTDRNLVGDFDYLDSLLEEKD